ncbi:hypothetical protein QAD02_010327 [Eretmocerus hayati]|uniref:Uncharacterized protein n=1 Tax=Eretmocerus hayati TaxID=131215 RepID=A0ACC2NBS1_9HYME|nr:hypothetical protein QAD02_010327 [Eretmocerus hayati]
MLRLQELTMTILCFFILHCASLQSYSDIRDCNKLKSSVCAVVDPEIIEVDRFSYAICNPASHQNNQTVCSINVEHLQHGVTHKTCKTTIVSLASENLSLWPYIVPFKNNIILPWILERGQHSTLLLDSFDVIYLHEVAQNSSITFKLTYDQNGKQVGDRISHFADLSSSTLNKQPGELHPYANVVPVSKLDAEKGYFFVPNTYYPHKLFLLSPEGRQKKMAIFNSTLLSHHSGTENITFIAKQENGKKDIYNILEMDSELKLRNNPSCHLNKTENIVKFFVAGQSTFLILTSEIVRHEPFEQIYYIRKIYSDCTQSSPMPITAINFKDFILSQIYKSYARKQVCINFLLSIDGVYPKVKYTGCVDGSDLNLTAYHDHSYP